MQRFHLHRGFTLVELLSVMAVIVIMSAALGPALSSLSGAGNTTKVASDVSSYIEMARTQAMSQNTFVWVGFLNVADSSSPLLAMAMVSSRDGSSDSSDANLTRLARPLIFQNFRAASTTDAAAANNLVSQHVTSLISPTPPSEISQNNSGVSFQSGNRTYSKTLTITPQGEVILAGKPTSRAPVDACLVLYLQKMRGTVASREQAAILINGASGNVEVVRE